MADWFIEDGAEIELDHEVGAVDAAIAGGAITVAVSDGPVRLLVEEVRGGPVVVHHEGGRLTIRHPRPESPVELGESGLFGIVDGMFNVVFSRGQSRRHAVIAVLLPAPVETRLKTATADIVVSGLGDVTAETVSGRSTVHALEGRLRSTSVSGDLEVAGIGGVASLKTVSGDITIAGGRLAELVAHTVSGDAVIDVDLSPGEHSFNTVSGDLSLRLDGDAGLDLAATSISGAVRCAIGEQTDNSRPGQRRVHTLAGDGSAHFRARTVSGDVTVLRRPAAAEVA